MVRSAAASATTRSNGAQRAIIVPVSGTALLLIDVINDLAFEGSAALIEQAEPMGSRLAALKRRRRTDHLHQRQFRAVAL
jgi:hypothetical protein